MKKKHFFQLGQDVVLTAVLLGLFGYHLWEEPIHEWLGIGFFALIISHTGLNFWWFKTLFKQQYNGYQRLKTSVNIAVFSLFLTACISGVLLSKHIFDEFFFHSTDDWVRKTHMLATHWLQIAIGVHLGLHWQGIGTMLSNGLKLDLEAPYAKLAGRILLPLMWLIITGYGIYVFIERDLLPYLLNQVNFAFFNFEESKLRFYFDFFAILIALAYMTRISVWALFFRQR